MRLPQRSLLISSTTSTNLYDYSSPKEKREQLTRTVRSSKVVSHPVANPEIHPSTKCPSNLRAFRYMGQSSETDPLPNATRLHVKKRNPTHRATDHD
jgi:hypothetical protein